MKKSYTGIIARYKCYTGNTEISANQHVANWIGNHKGFISVYDNPSLIRTTEVLILRSKYVLLRVKQRSSTRPSKGIIVEFVAIKSRARWLPEVGSFLFSCFLYPYAARG